MHYQKVNWFSLNKYKQNKILDSIKYSFNIILQNYQWQSLETVLEKECL